MKIHVFKRGIPESKWIAYNYTSKDIRINYCGYLKVDNPMDVDLWDLCNWSCWSQRKPKECKYLNITHCNSDVAYCINGEYYSHAMHKFNNFEECYKEMTTIGSKYFRSLFGFTEGFNSDDEDRLIYVTPDNINTII